ncbi:MAG: hypothetical protein H6Q33_223 [Deltaproteobacteria bacterium]|nr:hypothetical protein [Deltaproteobacteria bacterium]
MWYKTRYAVAKMRMTFQVAGAPITVSDKTGTVQGGMNFSEDAAIQSPAPAEPEVDAILRVVCASALEFGSAFSSGLVSGSALGYPSALP